MLVTLGESHDFVFDRGAVAWPAGFDLAAVHRGPMQVLANQLVDGLVGVADPAGQLLNITPHGVGLLCSGLEATVGSSIRIKVELGQQLAIRESIVRHCSENRFGVEFISKDQVSMDQIQKMISTMEIMRELKNREKHGA